MSTNNVVHLPLSTSNNPDPSFVLQSLKSIYGVSSDQEVLKRALSIALIANKNADADGNIHFLKKDIHTGEILEIILPQHI